MFQVLESWLADGPSRCQHFQTCRHAAKPWCRIVCLVKLTRRILTLTAACGLDVQVWAVLSAQAELLGVLESEGQELLLAEGGRGGRGNAAAPSQHQRPASKVRSDGQPGQEVGAPGLSNAGPCLHTCQKFVFIGMSCHYNAAGQLNMDAHDKARTTSVLQFRGGFYPLTLPFFDAFWVLAMGACRC